MKEIAMNFVWVGVIALVILLLVNVIIETVGNISERIEKSKHEEEERKLAQKIYLEMTNIALEQAKNEKTTEKE